MLKQVEFHGKRFEFCSVDGGRTWSTDPRSLIAFKRRQEVAREELRKRFEGVAENIPDPDPDNIFQLRLPKGSAGTS